MYEDLITRLRNTYTIPPSTVATMHEAADAIEELSAYVQQNDDLRAGYHDKAAARVAEGGNMLTIESYTDGIKPCTCNNCKHGPRMPNKVCNTCTIYKPGYGCWLPYANWEPKEE